MDNHFKGTIIILAVIFGFSLAITIIVVNFAKSIDNANPTVTPKVEEINDVDDIIVVEGVSNISSNLKNIINNDFSLQDKFNLNLTYHGVQFSIVCNSYDVENSKCTNYYGTMNVDDVIYNLFVYDGVGFNYINYLDSYYIYLDDNNVLLSYSEPVKNPGNLYIYDRNGNLLKNVGNVIHSYYLSNYLANGENPYIENNNVYYFQCNNNKPAAYTYSLNDGHISKIENINDSVCYK